MDDLEALEPIEITKDKISTGCAKADQKRLKEEEEEKKKKKRGQVPNNAMSKSHIQEFYNFKRELEN